MKINNYIDKALIKVGIREEKKSYGDKISSRVSSIFEKFLITLRIRKPKSTSNVEKLKNLFNDRKTVVLTTTIALSSVLIHSKLYPNSNPVLECVTDQLAPLATRIGIKV